MINSGKGPSSSQISLSTIAVTSTARPGSASPALRRNTTTGMDPKGKHKLVDFSTDDDDEVDVFDRQMRTPYEVDEDDGHENSALLLDNARTDRNRLRKGKEAKTMLRNEGRPRNSNFGTVLNKSRIIPLPGSLSRNKSPHSTYPANVTKNSKYNIITFLPLVLYEQFKFFFNLYFLLVALSQLVPALRIGFLITYILPLAFVLFVTLSKEASDDYTRHVRDRVANAQRYNILDTSAKFSVIEEPVHTIGDDEETDISSLGHRMHPLPPTSSSPASKLKVGDLVILSQNERVPADMVLLHTSDMSGTCFVRTDQLDGETDWKLKVSVEQTQHMHPVQLLGVEGHVWAEEPKKDIHDFKGSFVIRSMITNSLIADSEGSKAQEPNDLVVSLTVENILWANTVLAAGTAIGIVVYTGPETRAVMNTSHPQTKVGLLDHEINSLAKILCAVTFALSVLLVALNGFRGLWYVYVFRFLILFSTIIPISLRVNLDLGKTVYASQIQRDPEIPGTIVRTSTLPEELGRIEYLLSDKTGTLTQNEMDLKKLHMGTMSYGHDSMDEVAYQLSVAFGTGQLGNVTSHGRKGSLATGFVLANRGRRDMSARVKDVVLALALCHNVTPVINEDGSTTYQASSPDEVAIVRWTESVGLRLLYRDRLSMKVEAPNKSVLSFEILEIFPFTSESKRMGIVVRDRANGEIIFYQKGADAVMAKIVQYNDWLDEECGNMAREGLRTLVMARKKLNEETWRDFQHQYQNARISVQDRNEVMADVVKAYLEKDLELLGVTGVEDKLQEDVKMTLELLRNAGIKIWMLTGDKIETATCIAISTKLVARNQYIHQVSKLQQPGEVRDMLEFLQTKPDCCLVIDGESLLLCLQHFSTTFISIATQLPCVVACRCSPTQKADLAILIRAHTKKRVCCIGDGGNDVSMLQAADVGIGIVGKEGKQASLAADFSINQFSFVTKLLVWHGRNSYKRSAKLAQFVIHRGLIISVIQCTFSMIFYFSPIAIYQGWLMICFPTIYTMAPVFSLVMDTDINEDLALLYPELYKELTKGRSLSYKTFFRWTMVSVYQGGLIMILSLLLFQTDFINIVAISFTALILNELIMVALEVTTWHTYMVVSELVSIGIYAVSIFLLPEYFDLNFVLSVDFVWRTALIVSISAAPLWVWKLAKQRFAPASYTKLV